MALNAINQDITKVLTDAYSRGTYYCLKYMLYGCGGYKAIYNSIYKHLKNWIGTDEWCSYTAKNVLDAAICGYHVLSTESLGIDYISPEMISRFLYKSISYYLDKDENGYNDIINPIIQCTSCKNNRNYSDYIDYNFGVTYSICKECYHPLLVDRKYR